MGKKKKILILSGLILLLVAGAVGAYFGFANRQPAAEEITSKLYWNADRDEYIPELGGDTIRKPEKDGFYTVRFLVEGELVEYRVKDRETMISVDEKSALGLEIDKDGFITKAIDIRDMGIREVAKSFYVQTMQENVVVANSSVTGSAVDVSLRLSSESKIWNVTGKVDPYGVEDKLQLMDCIRAFNNESGTITDVFIVDREDILNGVSAERYCDHCQQVVTWRMWLGAASLPYSSGHFRLITDVELPDQYSMPADTDIVFDLNGKTISRKTQGRIISLHSEGDTLSIIDGSEEKTGMIKAFGEYAANGGVIWVRYGTLNLYAGTVNASEVIDAGANGAAIQVNPDTTFNMYGGTIIGGTAKPAVLKDEETGEKYTSGGMGGSIYCQGTINMYGGEILDGKVASAKDHKGEMAGIAGGNIALISKGTMNMYGGKISGGKVTEPYGHGGNISVRSEGAVLNISGGEIVKGVSTLQGANIASWGTITMTGGTIEGGKNVTGDSLKGATYNETSTSHNMFLVSSKFDMSGGMVAGHIGATNGLQDKNGNYIDCNIILSGTAKIKGANTNLTAGTSMIHFGKLSGDAYVSVNGSGFISTDTVATNQKYVHSDYEGSEVLYLEKRLFIGKQSCVCGLDENGKHFGECDGTLLAWQPWTKATYAPYESGNWYLLTDIDSEGINEAKPDATIRLDLNGKKIVGKVDRRVYSTVNGNVNLTITDLSKEKSGSIIARSGDNAEGIGRGGCVWVTNKKSKVTFYGGVLDASKVTALYNGAAVSVDPDCEFTMYGGNINGGKAVVNKKGEEGYAGTVFVRGQFNLNGGVIQGGSAEQFGGNVYVHSEEGAKFHMTGGKVIGGKAINGGNISGMGLISIAGGVVADGEAEYGGNICARRTMVMTGGEIKDGFAIGGGNIFASASSDLTISGGTISGGKATRKVTYDTGEVVNGGEGGNLRMWTDAKLAISNAVIKDGEANKDGGNIYLNNDIVVSIKNATITGGTSHANGGNICIGKYQEADDTTALISGTTIKGGHADKLGGNVYVQKGVTTLSGDVVILDGTMGNDKATSNLYLVKGMKVKLDGLTSASASIGVNSVNTTFATKANADKSDVARFFSDEGHPLAQTSKNELFLGKIGCMCGNHNGSHKTWCTEDLRNIEWHTWRDDTTLPGENEQGLYYYLTSDVELKSQLRLETKGTWGLDLNGKKVTNSDRACNLGGSDADIKYVITDTSAAGTGAFAYSEDTSSADGMLFFVQTGTKVDFYAGTIDGSGVTTTYGTTLVVSAGTFTMHDGLILPGDTTSKPVNGNYATNCVEVRQGTLDVKGGTIEGEVRITTSAGKLKVSGNSAKVGVAVSADANKAHGIFALHNSGGTLTGKVELNNLNVPAKLVFKNVENMTLSEAENSNSSIDAIELLNDGDGHFAVIKHDNKIRLASVICVCGENVTGKDSHTCNWTGEGNGITKVYDINWQAYTATSGYMPGYSTAGYYYLTNDYKLTGQSNIAVTSYLDLNGKTITLNDTSRNIHLGVSGIEYSIADSKGNGTIKASETYSYTPGYGGVVWIDYAATLNMYGGTIDMTNIAHAPTAPTNVNEEYHLIDLCSSTGARFAMYGGVIKPAKDGDCIGIRNANSTMSVMGGTIYGRVVLQTTANIVAVGGDAKVGLPMDGITYNGIEAWETDTNVICHNLTENADIRIASTKIKLVEAENSSSAVTAVKLMNNGDGHFAVLKHNNKIRFASVICACGANVTGQESHTCAWTGEGNGIAKVYDIKWQAYADASGKMPGYNASGYYYLTKNITLTQGTELSTTACLDLNGKTITASPNSFNIIINSANTNYSIADSKNGEGIKLPQNFTHAGYGSLVVFRAAGKLNLYSGVIDMTATPYVTYQPIDVAQGTFTMHGGVIKPAQSRGDYSNCMALRGSGSIVVNGGTIFGEILFQESGNTKLTVKNNAQVGVQFEQNTGYGILAWNAGAKLISENVSANARIIINSGNVDLSGTGVKEAFTAPAGFEIVETGGQLDMVRQ